MALQNDQIQLNDLRHLRFLGKGTFGNVHLTRDVSSKAVYALKTVSKRKILFYDLYENLQLEKQILLKTDHPFIMKLVKTFKDNKRIYFLTEYIPGMDLFDVILARPKLAPEEIQFYLGALTLALEHLHERKIVYRDLKPENVMVNGQGYPKLIDFGSARILHGHTYTLLGTPHYMAPEVITGKGYGVAADCWGLGVMLFELGYGYLPFAEEEEDPYVIYEKVLTCDAMYPEGNDDSTMKSLVQSLLEQNTVHRADVTYVKGHLWLANLK